MLRLISKNAMKASSASTWKQVNLNRFARLSTVGGDASQTSEQATSEATANGAAPEDPVIALKAEIKDLKDKLLRCYAEEENVRRIAKRDVEQAREYANTKFASALLEVADNLEMALASVPETKRAAADGDLKSLYQGVEMTDKLLIKVFHQFGIEKYGKVGDKFDPSIHDALFQTPSATMEEGTLSQVLKTGYKLKARVIRAAQVGAYTKPPSE